MKQNRIKMPQLQFVSIVLLRSGFIPINNLKSGRTFVNTVKTPVKTSVNAQILENSFKTFSNIYKPFNKSECLNMIFGLTHDKISCTWIPNFRVRVFLSLVQVLILGSDIPGVSFKFFLREIFWYFRSLMNPFLPSRPFTPCWYKIIWFLIK